MTNMTALEGFWSNATDLVAGLDNTFLWIHVILVGLMLTVLVPMFYFLWKYSAKRHPKEKTENIKHHLALEIAWTVIPTVFLMIIFYYGFLSLKVIRTMPAEAINISVTGKMWSWTYKYENGKITDKLYVPKDENVILNMTSPINDVIHSFFIPAFRVKEDVVPGKITKLWFNSNRVGEYDVQCTEYCGDRHSYMLSKVVVLPKGEYNAWMRSGAAYPGGPDASSEPMGKTLLTNNGCFGCHSIDGNVLVGPSFKGIVGRMAKTNNGELKSDNQYLRDSILEPNKDVVVGFPPGMMPPSKGILSDKDIDSIIEYLSTIK